MQLQHQAFHDSLTGLANRALFRAIALRTPWRQAPVAGPSRSSSPI
jgi:GGDEF domain-containing protein